jgi:hypothetical protein
MSKSILAIVVLDLLPLLATGCVLDLEGRLVPDTGPDSAPDTAEIEDSVLVDTMPDTPDVVGDDPGLDDPVTDPDVPDGETDPDMPPCDGPMLIYYVDADGDGYGDLGGGVEWCAPPPGFVDNHDDCYDAHPEAHPGQPDFFPIDRGDGSFDYDCDGVETVLYTAETSCDWGWCDGEGWSDGVPDCGVTANWRRCDWWVVWCDIADTARQQMCR